MFQIAESSSMENLRLVLTKIFGCYFMKTKIITMPTIKVSQKRVTFETLFRVFMLCQKGSFLKHFLIVP